MTNIVLLLAALLFAFGVLIGSVLHTQAVHREYRRITERVHELRELQQVLADKNEFPVLATENSPHWKSYLE